MLTTEKEAKTKACRELRVHSADGKIGINAFAKQDKSGIEIVPLGHCIASKCMGWRWYDQMSLKRSDRRGYCGYAGEAKI